ncbi:carboxypeptidase regulatory-like domain-containing protein [Rhodobacteraceae bacterium]|nr:carboxypeptidase regulatory-like domain-containing protein [Paracoccaceae bacterium]
MLLNRRQTVLGGVSALASFSLGSHAYAQATAYQEIDRIPNASTVKGRLSYNGPEIEVREYQVSKDHAICGTGTRAPTALRVSDEGYLGDCVVEIRGVSAGKPWQDVFSNGKIYQIDCSFQPYVQILRHSAFVEVINYDELFHNIHAYEMFNGVRRQMFNFAQPKAGDVDRIDLKFRRGNTLMIDCNAHNWMEAYVYTSVTPYFAVTSLDGNFEIPEIPSGNYELIVWHPVLGRKSANISVAPNDELNLTFAIS